MCRVPIPGRQQLLAALRAALAEYESVPPEFIEAAENAFAWHNIDAELARLTYDSIQHQDVAGIAAIRTAGSVP